MFSYFNYIRKNLQTVELTMRAKVCNTFFNCLSVLEKKDHLLPHATRRNFASGHETRTTCPSAICLLLFLLRSPSSFSSPRICVCCRSRSSRSLGQKKLLLLEIKFCEQQQPKEPERRHSMWHVRRFVCCSTCSSSVYLLFFIKLGVILIVRLEF